MIALVPREIGHNTPEDFTGATVTLLKMTALWHILSILAKIRPSKANNTFTFAPAISIS